MKDTTTPKQETCEDRIGEHLESRLQDIRQLWAKERGEDPHKDGEEAECPECEAIAEYDELDKSFVCGACNHTFEPDDDDIGEFNEYGLSIDYVPGRTEYNPGAGYLRYQLSWGGPSDEFRFFVDADGDCYRIEYWFLDWFDGAHRILRGSDESDMLEIFDYFKELGILESEIRKAREE